MFGIPASLVCIHKKLDELLKRISPPRPTMRDMEGAYVIQACLGGAPNPPVYCSDFLQAWDYFYGRMIQSEWSEAEARTFLHLHRIQPDGKEKRVSWDDFPQNKESREAIVSRWALEHVSRPGNEEHGA